MFRIFKPFVYPPENVFLKAFTNAQRRKKHNKNVFVFQLKNSLRT